MRTLAVCLTLLLATAAHASTLIGNVSIVDGTGSKSKTGAVRIENDRIQAMGQLQARDGEQVIDGRGLTLAPGFIDTHSHHEADLPAAPDMIPVTNQGITTIIIGQDGFSQTPLADYYSKLQHAPAAVNIGSYSGHNTLRQLTMKDGGRRAAAETDITQMSTLLQRDIADGAFGLSTGLLYETGNFSTRAEVLALAKVSARNGGRYISHIRNEGFELFESLDEIIEIGRQTHAPVQVSHIKVGVKKMWGQADRVLELLNRARASGVDITADLYPYTYWQSTMRVLFPNKDYEDRAGLAFMFEESTPPDRLYFASFDPDRSVEGKSVAQLARERNSDPVTVYVDLMQQVMTYEKAHPDKERVESVMGESMRDDDVARLLAWEHTNICTDGFPSGHPRGHGTFTRVLGTYTRERGVLTLETAIHKMTGLAARHLGLKDRGVIAAGAYADLVLFDPREVADRATMVDPTALSVGIRQVWVNGQIVYENGRATGRHPGQVVRRVPN